MQTQKSSLLGKLKVRTSLILVLVFFFIMLISGALLGVVSLKLNNNSLKDIAAQETTLSELDGAISEYLSTRSSMGNIIASIIVNSDLQNNDISTIWNDSDDVTNTLSDETRSMVDDSRSQLEKAQRAVGVFKASAAKTLAADSGADAVISKFEALVNTELPALLDLLSQGDIDKYIETVTTRVNKLNDDLETAYIDLKISQAEIVNQSITTENDHLNLVILLVGIAMLVSLLFAVAAYIFLQKVVLRPLHLAGQHFDRIANGDLTADIQVNSKNEIGVLYSAMQRMQTSLINMVDSVRTGVGEIRLGSQEIFAGNTDLSSRTEQQAASLQETAASMEQLSSTVKLNADNAHKADELAVQAATVAERGAQAVQSVADTMVGITDSSGKIAEIVNVIDSIAFQTNILALNAAVEAARAGEQGRGFAVVAGEVRSLAQRSSQAANEIKDLIDDSVNRVKDGSTRAEDAAKIMQEIEQQVHNVTSIMREIASASQEQSEGISQINLAVTEMDSVVQQNAALVQQSASAAGSLQDQAENLDNAVAAFKLKSTIDMDNPAVQQLQNSNNTNTPTLALGHS